MKKNTVLFTPLLFLQWLSHSRFKKGTQGTIKKFILLSPSSDDISYEPPHHLLFFTLSASFYHPNSLEINFHHHWKPLRDCFERNNNFLHQLVYFLQCILKFFKVYQQISILLELLYWSSCFQWHKDNLN